VNTGPDGSAAARLDAQTDRIVQRVGEIGRQAAGWRALADATDARVASLEAKLNATPESQEPRP